MGPQRGSCVVVVVLLLVLVVATKGQVFQITETNFDKLTRDKDVMLIQFYMPW